MQPIFSWTLDYDSDRNLSSPSAQGSEEAVLSADLRLQRSLENMQITLEPHFDLRRFSDSIWGPGDDRSLAGAYNWTGERMQFSLNASIANQNTLTTELLETGIVNTNSRRRASQASAEWDWSRTEKHQFFTQLSYMDTSYSGPALVQLELPGYRYYSGSLGERFFLTEHLTMSVSAFGDALGSDRFGASSHEEGGQLGLIYAHSEKTSFNVSVGESERSLAGPRSTGTNAAASITHNLSLGSVALNYTRSLMPYGTGVLVQRQQLTASATRPLTPYLSTDVAVLRVQNNSSTVQLGLDRPYYDNAVAGLNWQLGERWTMRSEATTSWSRPIRSNATVREWRAALIMTWKPSPSVLSR
jgi:hypothetical protein